VKKVGSGHVVVGQLKMEGNASASDAIAQMEILEDGYFVDAVATTGAPIHFWYPGYDRLDILPQGKPLSIENLGQCKMSLKTRPGGIVRTRMVANGSQVPIGLAAKLTYSIPFINKCGLEKISHLEIEKKLLQRLAKVNSETIQIEANNGELTIVELPTTRFELIVNSSENDWWSCAMDVSPGEEFNLGDCEMHRIDAAQLQGPSLAAMEWAANGKSQVQILLAKMANRPRISQYFQNRLDKHIQSVEDARKKIDERAAVVIVGQIQLADNDVPPTSVAAQMLIANDGYFCDAVLIGAPTGFRLHRYEPLDYIPKPSKDGVDMCGVLRMVKTREIDTSILKGVVLFEEGQPTADFRIAAQESPVNCSGLGMFGGYEARAIGSTKPPVPTILGNNFQFSGMSPIKYLITATGSGYVDQWRSATLGHSESVVLPPFRLFRTRSISFSHLPSKRGEFKNVNRRQSAVPSDRGSFRSFEDPLVYQNFTEDLKVTQVGNAIFGTNRFGLSIVDLGVCSIDECRSISTASIPSEVTPARGAGYMLKLGHVYLLKELYLKHWVLLKVDAIAKASITGK